MKTLAKTAVALSFVGAAAIGTTTAVQAQYGYGYYPHPYYHHYGYYGGGYRTWNGCPPDWTVQSGVCKPYRHGPWDIYGGGRAITDGNIWRPLRRPSFLGTPAIPFGLALHCWRIRIFDRRRPL